MINRRKVVKGIGATGVAVAMPSWLRAQELRKIRMGFGIKSVNPIVINILISSSSATPKKKAELHAGRARHQRQCADRARQGRHRVRRRHAGLQFPLFAKGQLPPIVNLLRIHLSL
jgi:hypothetical protein